MAKKYALGLDFGTNSVRSLVVNVATGEEVGTHVALYKSGDEGVITDSLNPHLARQNPKDWLDGLEESVKKAVEAARSDPDFSPERIIGIGVDTTGSTPLPVDEKLTPLCFYEEFRGNKNALAWLWKDHTSAEEAAKITEIAREIRPQYLATVSYTHLTLPTKA